jgi:hypothetical protein
MVDTTWYDEYSNSMPAPVDQLTGFVIVTTSDLATVRFTYQADGTLVPDNGMGLPMPEGVDAPPSYMVNVENLPAAWETYDTGMYDIRYECNHSMQFFSSAGSSS